MRMRWVAACAGLLLVACGSPSGVGPKDGGSEDAGSLDGGVGDAGTHPDGGPGTCANHSYKVCEDFESTATGQIPGGWTLKTNYGDHPTSPEVVDDTSHTGSKALRSHSSAEGQNRIQKSLSSLGATAGTHWGRVFVRVQQPVPMPSGGGYLHGTFIAYPVPGDEVRVMDWVRAPSGNVEISYQLSQGAFDKSTEYTYDFDGSWSCVEWYVDSVTHSFRYFFNGTEATALAFTGQADSKLQSFQEVILGSLMFQALPSDLVVWFDDFALDDARVGCGN